MNGIKKHNLYIKSIKNNKMNYYKNYISKTKNNLSNGLLIFIYLASELNILTIFENDLYGLIHHH